MQRYRKRFNLISAVCAVMLMFTVLAACSGGNGKSNEPAASKGNGAEEAGNDSGTKEAEQESKQSDKSMQGEVNVISIWGGGITDKFNSMMVEFNKVYPNIKVNYMEQGIGELAALISAGNTPDIIIADGGRFPRDWVKDNLIEDLAPYIESDPDVNPDMFYEPAYKRGTDPDGKVWQLPFLVDPNFPILYNREVLEQYGNSEIPEIHSLQEMGDFLKSYWIVENGEQVMTTFSPFEVYGNFNSLLTFAYLNGADSSSFYNPAAGTAAFNDPKVVEALEWMIQFKRENIDDDRMNKLNATLPENTSRFAAGKSLLQPSVIVHVQENLKLNPDLQLTPMPEESLWIGGHGLSLTTLGKKENKEAAWTLLKWISSSKDGAEANLKIFGNISGIKENPYFLQQTETDPVMKIAYDVLQQAAKLPPFFPVQYEGEFDQKFGEVVAGTLEPKAFLDHMTKFTQALLDEQKK